MALPKMKALSNALHRTKSGERPLHVHNALDKLYAAFPEDEPPDGFREEVALALLKDSGYSDQFFVDLQKAMKIEVNDAEKAKVSRPRPQTAPRQG